MKSVLRLAFCAVLGFVTMPMSGQRSSYDPSAPKTDQQRDSFAEFALKQLNPQNTDYGCQIEEARKVALHETIESIDFWTILVTSTFLVLSFFMILHQQKECQRREVIAAEILAQYHNGWVDASKQAEIAIRRYNELVSAKNRSTEEDLRAQSLDALRTQGSTLLPDNSLDPRHHSSSSATTANSATYGGKGVIRSDSGREIKATVPALESEFIAQIRTLQQQLTASHEREKQLQKQIGKSQRRLPGVLSRDTNAAD